MFQVCIANIVGVLFNVIHANPYTQMRTHLQWFIMLCEPVAEFSCFAIFSFVVLFFLGFFWYTIMHTLHVDHIQRILFVGLI